MWLNRIMSKIKGVKKPKNKASLEKLIEKSIKLEGDQCDLNYIDTSLITDMSYLFEHSYFNGDISVWNVYHVKEMSGMFYKSKFNGNISNWNVSNVTNMANMFASSIFNEDISV